MRSIIRPPPRCNSGTASPVGTLRLPQSTWLSVRSATLWRVFTGGKRSLAIFLSGPRPQPACAYTMLVASDLRRDSYGMAL
jgi:hypothetical protein